MLSSAVTKMRREVYMTNSMDILLRNFRARLTPPEYLKLVTDICKKIDVIQARLAQQNPGKGRARWTHKFLQDLIDREKKAKAEQFSQVPCKTGCSGCCHQQIEINGDEAKLLASLVDNGLKVDMEKLERQAKTAYGHLEWWRQPQADKACIFLDQGTGQCRVYANRPLVCRKYYVFTEPARCSDVSEEGSIEVGVYAIPEVEIAATAVMDYVRGESNMAKGIWKNLKRKR